MPNRPRMEELEMRRGRWKNPWFSEDPGGLHGCYFRLSDVAWQELTLPVPALDQAPRAGSGS